MRPDFAGVRRVLDRERADDRVEIVLAVEQAPDVGGRLVERVDLVAIRVEQREMTVELGHQHVGRRRSAGARVLGRVVHRGAGVAQVRPPMGGWFGLPLVVWAEA